MSLKIIIASVLFMLSAEVWTFEHPQSQELGNALASMQNQKTDKFIVVEIPGTTNYFQFVVEGNNSYIFDVPTMSLSSGQLKRAEEYFSKWGVKVITVRATDPNSRKSFTLNAYQKMIDRKDLKSGVQIGLGFMVEVIQYQEYFNIIKGWE